MPVNTIAEPSADQIQQMVYNKSMRKGGMVRLPIGQKLAVVAISLAPAVTQADYPALKMVMEAISGIQAVSLLVDGRTPDSIPENTELRLYVDAHLRIDNLPEPPPE